MGVVTIKEYAESQNVSYEAVRKQIVRYADDLGDHIIRKNRTQYLDDWAVEFLTERRKENPVVIVSQNKDEEIESLRSQIETLRVQLLTAQNELLKEKDRVIGLQDEARKTIEDRAKYTALLEDNKDKEERLKKAGDQIGDLSRQIEEKDGQIQTIQKEADDLRAKSEEDQKTIEDLRKERDEAQTEAQSFTRSIFGLYRKVKG